MATMRHESTGSQVDLYGRTMLGRSPLATVRLAASGASHEHATIQWNGADWVLRDLSSRNGTRVNGTLLIGKDWPLRAGDILVFGDPEEQWHWLDGSGPEPAAVAEDGTAVRGKGGLLILGEPDVPHASVYQRADHWEIDVDGELRTVTDGETICVGGRNFVLSFPDAGAIDAATRSLLQERTVAAARATLRVSADEEHVDLVFHTTKGTTQMRSRTFHYMLLTLARARLADRENGISPGEAGWVYVDELATKLQTTIEKLNVDIHRARGALAKLKLFEDPDGLVQRRSGAGQIRLGIGQVAVETFEQ
jgi:hypothetical protein